MTTDIRGAQAPKRSKASRKASEGNFLSGMCAALRKSSAYAEEAGLGAGSTMGARGLVTIDAWDRVTIDTGGRRSQ